MTHIGYCGYCGKQFTIPRRHRLDDVCPTCATDPALVNEIEDSLAKQEHDEYERVEQWRKML